MKKRILSMLLAVVMMVTAMPLFILASSAEEATPVYPSTTKEEYNALYVQEGLVLQYDFFDSNEYWGGDYSDGTNRLTLDNTYTMDAAKSDFDGKYRIYYSPLYGNSNNARIGVNGIAVYPTVGEGYMALKLDAGCKWNGNALGSKGRGGTYMINTGFVNTEGTYTYTLQQVTSYTDLANLRTESEYSNIKNHPQYFIGNVSIYMAANADGNFYFDKVSDGFNTGTKVDASSTAASHSFKPGEIIDYTAVLSQPLGEGEGASEAQPGTVGFYVNGKEAYRNDAFPFTNLPSTRYADDYYAVWRGAYEGSTYAIRYYNIALTEEHIAKNHFADLAKYFRLDLTSYNTYKDSLTDAQMKNALASLSSVTFDNTREEAQAAVDKAFEPALLDDSYYAGFEGAVDEKILAVAKKFKLNIDIFKVMPIALMKKTRAWFAAVDLNEESLDATAVQAEFIRKTEEDILDYAGESVLDADGYNALYEKNGLVLQYDFFDSNKYWGGDYSDGTNRLTLDSTYTMDAAKSDFDGKYRIYYSPLYGNSNNARIGVNGIAVYPTVGEGYMALKLDGGCKWNGNALGSKGKGGTYMINTGFVNTEGTYTYTLQQVTSYTDLASLRTESEYSNIKDRPQYYIGNVSIYMAANADGNFYFDKVSDGFNPGTKVDVSSTAASHSFKPGEIIDYTAVLSQPLGEGEGASEAQPGTVGFYVNGKEAYRNDAFPFTNLPSTRYADDYYAVWRGAYEGSTYAIRYYNIALTEKHIAKNHFADVAKWYKLGLVGFADLSAGKKECIYEAFANVTVDDPRYSRTDVQAIYIAALHESYAAEYEQYKNGVPEHDAFIEVAAAYRLSIDAVVNSPFDMSYVYRSVTFETLDGKTFSEAQEILDRAVEQVVGKIKVYTQEDYNKLYAQQEHLTLWFDFFSSTEGIIDEETVNTDMSTFGSAEVPSVFRAGKMQISNLSPTTNTYDRAMLDGFFRMHATASSGPVYPNIEVLPDERYFATDLVYSDYTWEVVASDFNGYSQNMQIDNVRLAFGDGGNKLHFGAVSKHDVRVKGGSHSEINAETVHISSSIAVGKEVYYDVSPALGSTITLRYDKDFTVNPVSYFKVTPTDDGTYTEDGRSQITLDEAKELLGFEGTEAELQEHLALPTREALTEVNYLSQFVKNQEGVYVFAVRYPAEADVKVELNGTEHFSGKMTMGVAGGFVLTGIGSGVNMNVYSLRRYDIALTDEELLQNHFVDLCKYYNLDITAYLTMDDDTRALAHKAMKGFLIKDDATAVNAAWKAFVKEYYYDVLKVNFDDKFNDFFDKAAGSLVDLTVFLARPAEVQAQVANVFGDMELGTHRLVMEKLLQEALKGIDKTNEEMASELVSFDGYQVRLAIGATKMPGIRANFVVDKAVLETLEAAGYKVSFGAAVTGESTATLTVYDGVEYVGETYSRMGADRTAELCFTYTTLYDEASLRNKENFGKEITYTYWVTLEKEGEDAVTFTFDCESARFGDAVSAAEVYDYFRDVKGYAGDAMVYEVASAMAEKQLVDMTILGKNVADYTLVYDDIFTKEMAEEIAAAIEEMTGTKLTVVARGVLHRPNLQSPAIWLMGRKNIDEEAAMLEGADFAWYSETRSGSIGIVVIDTDKLDGFVEAVKAELAAAVSEGKLTLGTADSPIEDYYFNAAVAE